MDFWNFNCDNQGMYLTRVIISPIYFIIQVPSSGLHQPQVINQNFELHLPSSKVL